MNAQNFLIKSDENKTIEISDFSSVNIELESNSKFDIKFLKINEYDKIEIAAKVGQNSVLNVTFADFSNCNLTVKSCVDLVDINATCNWHLATLAKNDNKKTFDISFNHLEKITNANMDNYGVAKDKSNISFSGCSHIFKGCKNSITKQNAKIIVFNKESSGTASPILRIDENDVVASHGAVVGQLNENHMFYLMSRGLSEEDARKLIILGYLKPISEKFSKNSQKIIENQILENAQ